MQSIAATGSMRIQLTAAEGATKFDVVYSVVGYLPAGMQTWAKPADAMLTEQFRRLQNYIEHGDPTQNRLSARVPSNMPHAPPQGSAK
jgi:hypothetical protein